MYLTLRKSRGHSYLYLMESTHIKGERNPKKTVIKNYGRYDLLPEDIRKSYEDKKTKKELAARLENEIRMGQLKGAQNAMAPAVLEPDQQGSTPRFNRAYSLCYGHLALRNIWRDALGLQYKIDYLQKTETNIREWRLSDVLFYLCALKLLSPRSYLDACASKSNFLYCPWNNVAQDNFYRALDFVYEFRGDLIKHAVTKHNSARKTEVKVAFFDCTNIWCETPYDDVTWQIIRYTRKVRQEMAEKGSTDEQIANHLASDEFAQELASELELKQDEVLRMRGKSKEGRYAQPIVTVALAIDQTGFPIDCEVFAGNLSELRTITPMLQSLKKKYSVKDIYFVADRGLNSTETLDKLKEEKLGFVVAQKVSRQKADCRKEMLDTTGYKNYRIEDDALHAINQDLNAEDFRYKVCDHEKSAYVKLPPDADGVIRQKKVKVKCKIVYTYSPERKKRDLMDLQTQISRATRAINESQLMGNPFGTGWRALVKTSKEVSENKTDKEMYRAKGLKDDVIKERQAIAGYAAIVFSHPDNLQTSPLTEEEVLSTYHKLVTIEDCFRVMKSNFSIRPMHVRLHERITAHCYLCVLSLMMAKIVQEKLRDMGIEMTTERIGRALLQAQVVPIPSGSGTVESFMNVGFDPKFHSPEYTDKGATQCEENETENHSKVWSNYEKAILANGTETDQILTAVGLSPLSIYNTMGEVKTALGLKNQPDGAMIAPEHLMLLSRLRK